MQIKKLDIKFNKPIYLQEEILINIKLYNAENKYENEIKFTAEIIKI